MNIRTETNTAWVTCARTTASSLEMAAAISATQARNPITLRTIRAVINRCPIGDTPYRAAPALPDGTLHIRSPRWHGQAECLGSLEIDDQPELGRLHSKYSQLFVPATIKAV